VLLLPLKVYVATYLGCHRPLRLVHGRVGVDVVGAGRLSSAVVAPSLLLGESDFNDGLGLLAGLLYLPQRLVLLQLKHADSVVQLHLVSVCYSSRLLDLIQRWCTISLPFFGSHNLPGNPA
jgi:hypothetical protein